MWRKTPFQEPKINYAQRAITRVELIESFSCQTDSTAYSMSKDITKALLGTIDLPLKKNCQKLRV